MYIEIVVEKDKQGNYRFQKVVIWVSEDDQEYWDGGKIGAQTRFLQFCASIVAGEDVTEPEEVLFGDFWQRFFPDWPEHPLDPKNKEEWTKWGDRLREDIKAGKLSLQTHFVQRSKVSPTPEPTEIPTATPTPRPTETPTPRPTETPTPQPPETAEKRIERALNSFPLPVISEAENNGYEYLPTLLRVGRPADGRRGCAASPRQCIPACGRWRPPPASGHIPLPRGRCENGRSTGEAPLRPSAGLRAQVSFGPVVGERDTFHRREGRDRLLVLPQAAIWGVPGPPGVRAVVLPVPPGSRSGGSVAGRLWPPLRARGEPARGGPTGRYASPRARTGGREGQRFLRLPHRGPAAGLRGCAPGAGRRATGGAAMGKQVLRVPLVVSLYLSGMPERPAAVEKEEK